MNMTNTEAVTLDEHRDALKEVSATLESLQKLEKGFDLFSAERRRISEVITALLCSKDAYFILTELSCARQIRLRDHAHE